MHWTTPLLVCLLACTQLAKLPSLFSLSPVLLLPSLAVDHEAQDLPVWESGSVLMYLAEQRDPQRRLLPADPALRTEVLSWLFWQVVSQQLGCS